MTPNVKGWMRVCSSTGSQQQDHEFIFKLMHLVPFILESMPEFILESFPTTDFFLESDAFWLKFEWSINLHHRLLRVCTVS